MDTTIDARGQAGVIYGLHRGDGVIRYVGLTTLTAPHRLSQHRIVANAGLRRPLYYWMRKHGPETIETVVLETVDDAEQLDEREIYWINELGTFIGLKTERNGFNCTTGGRRSFKTSQDNPYDHEVECDSPEDLLEWILECAEFRETNAVAYDKRLEDLREWYAEPLRNGMSIDEFAVVHERRKHFSRCVICALPVELIAQVEDARDRDNPLSFTLIAEWLESEYGLTINPLTIPNHFRGLHHKR